MLNPNINIYSYSNSGAPTRARVWDLRIFDHVLDSIHLEKGVRLDIKSKDCRLKVDYSIRAAMGLLAHKAGATTGNLASSLLSQVIEQAYPEILTLLDKPAQDRLTGVKYWTQQRINVSRPEEES